MGVSRQVRLTELIVHSKGTDTGSVSTAKRQIMRMLTVPDYGEETLLHLQEDDTSLDLKLVSQKPLSVEWH